MECEAPEVARDAPCILVVEDEPLIRFVIAEALREEGVRVIEAASGDEAWQYLQVESVDLVFTDHRMPGSLKGADLAARIAARFPQITTILTSGDFDGQGYSGRLVRKPYSLLAVTGELGSAVKQKKVPLE